MNANSGAGNAHNLALRVGSAAVLAPFTLICAYVDGWLFLALCAAAAATVFWEWTHLLGVANAPRVLVPHWLGLAVAAVLTGLGYPAAAVFAATVGVLAAGAAIGTRPPREATPRVGLWTTAGGVYAAIVFFGPALIRRDPEWGFVALVFLLAIVWATDISAFFCGRAIGGPRLWPSVSPNKTWSGAVGGLAGGLAAGVLVAYASGTGKLVVAGVMGLVLSVLAQAGDLFESAVKRHFGAKDASHLIPGHGGLMDRLDGFMVAALAALLIGILHQGVDAPGRGLLLW
jgi:phosphatidate cytidylyltransferase